MGRYQLFVHVASSGALATDAVSAGVRGAVAFVDGNSAIRWLTTWSNA